MALVLVCAGWSDARVSVVVLTIQPHEGEGANGKLGSGAAIQPGPLIRSFRPDAYSPKGPIRSRGRQEPCPVRSPSVALAPRA